MTAGCSLELASKIAQEIEQNCYEGMSTEEIRKQVYEKLASIDKTLAEKYLYRTNL
jgi:2-phosphoglycerate kinase